MTASLGEYRRAVESLQKAIAVDRQLRSQYKLTASEDLYSRNFSHSDRHLAESTYENLVWAVLLLARSSEVDRRIAILCVEHLRNRLRWSVKPGRDSRAWTVYQSLTSATSWQFDWRPDSFAGLDQLLASKLTDSDIMLFKLTV